MNKNKDAALAASLFDILGNLTSLDVDRFGAFGAFRQLEGNGFTFDEGLEAFALDVAVMDERIRTIFTGYEPVTLRVIEPLDRTFSHAATPLENWHCGFA